MFGILNINKNKEDKDENEYNKTNNDMETLYEMDKKDLNKMLDVLKDQETTIFTAYKNKVKEIERKRKEINFILYCKDNNIDIKDILFKYDTNNLSNLQRMAALEVKINRLKETPKYKTFLNKLYEKSKDKLISKKEAKQLVEEMFNMSYGFQKLIPFRTIVYRKKDGKVETYYELI